MSEISRYAHVNPDGLIVNCSVWDGVTEYDPGDDITLVKVPDGVGAGPGWTYDGTNWTAPPVEDEEGEG
jgi:hypothetical protein